MAAYNDYERHHGGIIHNALTMGQKGGLLLTPNNISPLGINIKNSPVVTTYGTTWDEKNYETARSPIVIADAGTDFSKVTQNVSCHSMAIKFPGTDVRLPFEQEQFRHAVQACIDFEAAANPNYKDDFLYLAIDQSLVAQGAPQRTDRMHSDGVQGPRIQPKKRAEHTFLAADSTPTLVYHGAFDMTDIKADTHYLVPVFEAQANPEHWRPLAPKIIQLIDCYTVHDAAKAEQPGLRTFFKLTSAQRPFDRIGNTVNAMFDYKDWDWQPRPIPPNLIGYDH